MKIWKVLVSLFRLLRYRFLPPILPLVDSWCDHCGREFPRQFLYQNPVEIHHSETHISYFHPKLCAACLLINPKFHHYEEEGARQRYFWEDEYGNVYETYDFENGNGRTTKHGSA